MKSSFPIASPQFSAQQTAIKKQVAQKPLAPINFGAKQTKQATPKFGHLFSSIFKTSEQKTTERIQRATEKANKASQKAQEKLIQSFVVQAQIPTTKFSELKRMNLNGDKVNQLEDLLTENEDYSGLLLKGNTENNLSLIEALCQNRQVPLLTEAPELSLSNYAHSSDGIPILESMLEAAEQVADEQGSCVVYLSDLDSLKYSDTFHYSIGASSLRLQTPAQGGNFIKASLKRYFEKQADNDQKPSKVIIVFDKKHLEDNPDEALTRTGRLKPLDMTTETEEKQVEQYKYLKQKAQTFLKSDNVQFSDKALKAMAQDTRTEEEANGVLIQSTVVETNDREQRILELVKAEMGKIITVDHYTASPRD